MKKIFFSLFALMLINTGSVSAAVLPEHCGRVGQPACVDVDPGNGNGGDVDPGNGNGGDVDPGNGNGDGADNGLDLDSGDSGSVLARNQITVDAYGGFSNRYTGNTYNFLNNSIAGVYTQQVAPVSSNNGVRTYVQTKRTDKESFDAYNSYSRHHYYYVRPAYVYPVYNRVVTRTYVRTFPRTFPRTYLRPVYNYYY